MLLKLLLTIYIIVIAPLFALADHEAGHAGGSPAGGGSPGIIKIKNPLGYDTFTGLLDSILNWLLLLASPVAVIMMLWAASLFMTAGGNQERLTMAKKTLLWTIVGIFILMISKGITSTICSFLETTC